MLLPRLEHIVEFLCGPGQLLQGSLAFEVRPQRPDTLPPLLLLVARLAHDPPYSAWRWSPGVMTYRVATRQ
jgi:hypothetical protein